MIVAKSIAYFVLAGLRKTNGRYLVWMWLQEGNPIFYGVVEAVILVLYGVIPTLHPAHIYFSPSYGRYADSTTTSDQDCTNPTDSV